MKKTAAPGVRRGLVIFACFARLPYFFFSGRATKR